MRWGSRGQWVLFEKFVIGPPDDPYMIRWRLFECPWFRVFLHWISRSDADRELHDHPFDFVSLILWGGYWEWTPSESGWADALSVHKYRAPRIIFRRAESLHRLELFGIGRDEQPALTLVIAGPRRRPWGFLTEAGWVDHREYHGLEGF